MKRIFLILDIYLHVLSIITDMVEIVVRFKCMEEKCMFLRVYFMLLVSLFSLQAFASDNSQQGRVSEYRVCGEHSCSLNLEGSNCIRSLGYDPINAFAFIGQGTTVQGALVAGTTYVPFGQSLSFDKEINGVQAVFSGAGDSFLFVASGDHVYAYAYTVNNPSQFTLLGSIEAPDCINSLGMHVFGDLVVLYAGAGEYLSSSVFSLTSGTFVVPVSADKKLTDDHSLCRVSVASFGPGIVTIVIVKDGVLYGYDALTLERVFKFDNVDEEICGVAGSGSDLYVAYDYTVARLDTTTFSFSILASQTFDKTPCVISAIGGNQVIVGQCEQAILATI
jgi:hypothetical protein